MIATETLDPRYDPEQLAQGYHTRSDLVWYADAQARLDRGLEGGPQPPVSILGQLASDESRVSSDRGWLSPHVMRLDADRRRADAIERTLSRVLRLDVQLYRMLMETWVRRGGQSGESLDAFYLEVGCAVMTLPQRVAWTTRHGKLRISAVVSWARWELVRASQAYDQLREPACDG